MPCMVTMRKALDEFCVGRSIQVDSPLAIDAAQRILGLAYHDLTSTQLRDELDQWYQELASQETTSRIAARRRSMI